MHRVTITLDDALMAELDAIIAERGYQNRSEAIRDLARAGIRDASESAENKGPCVAALVYVYDHAARQLSKRLTDAYHAHHELSLASLHVHLDEATCLEVTVLRGSSGEVQHFGEHVIAERGVRHGKIVRLPVDETAGAQSGAHSHGHHHHDHRSSSSKKKPARRSASPAPARPTRRRKARG
jgi:CopG family transcriptional regulator, nickel-responsive regulator